VTGEGAAAARWHGRGKASGAPTDVRQFDVYELRDHEVIRATLGCRSPEEARKAAAIEEQAMSADANVEIARRFTETMARGDYETAAAMLAPTSPSMTPTSRSRPAPTPSTNKIGRCDAAFEGWRIEDLEVGAIGEDRTLSLFRIYARGTGSRVELARDDAAIADYHDGKIVRIAYYNDQAQALEAAAEGGRR